MNNLDVKQEVLNAFSMNSNVESQCWQTQLLSCIYYLHTGYIQILELLVSKHLTLILVYCGKFLWYVSATITADPQNKKYFSILQTSFRQLKCVIFITPSISFKLPSLFKEFVNNIVWIMCF